MQSPLSVRTIIAGFVIAAATLVGSASAQPCSPEEVAKLLASDGATDDELGYSVSISGDTAVIGALFDDDNGTNSGAAYVYRFDGTGWVQKAKLLPDDGAEGYLFGQSVSVSDDTAVIGSGGDDASGSAYVFRYDGTDWVLEAKLLPDDGTGFDYFGFSVSVSGDTAVIGAYLDADNGINSGSAYVYRFDGTNWVQDAKLIADDGAPGDLFGLSVSVSGDTAVIGAYLDADNGNSSGSAYVFRYDGTGWVLEAKLLPDDGTELGYFGFSVSVSGDTAIIGSWSGSAYVFTQSGGVWTQQAKLLSDDWAADDFFGRSVSISGDTAVIGADSDDDNGSESGSAYVYRFDGTSWTQQAKLLPADGAAGDYFGWSVSVSGDIAVIGAWGNDDNGTDSGSAYVYDLNPDLCLPDVNCDGRLAPTDFTAWINAFNNNLPRCDQNGDGACTPADFTSWIANFNAGC